MHLPAETVWLIVLAASLALIGLLIVMQRRTRRSLKQHRAGLFTASYGALETYRITQAGIDYPEMQATYRGHAFHVDVVVDTLTIRRLPVLWLRVSLLAPLPGIATFDILVRSQNVEFYSPSAELPHRLEPLHGWPADAMVRTDNHGRLPDLAVLDRHMGMFHDPPTKELLITPKGVRIVRMLDQAKRAEYLVMRQAEFENAQVTAELLRDLMDRTIALHQDLRS
jgi:hypothetical protein